MPDEHCHHEDRWEAVQRDLAEVKQAMARDATATWVRWAIPLTVTLAVTVFGVLQDKIGAVESYAQARVEESLADRRALALRTGQIEVRQKEQFERILEELKHLNKRIDERR